jgi:hypothetical protein
MIPAIFIIRPLYTVLLGLYLTISYVEIVNKNSVDSICLLVYIMCNWILMFVFIHCMICYYRGNSCIDIQMKISVFSVLGKIIVSFIIVSKYITFNDCGNYNNNSNACYSMRLISIIFIIACLFIIILLIRLALINLYYNNCFITCCYNCCFMHENSEQHSMNDVKLTEISVQSDFICCICLSNEVNKYAELPCKHAFHHECITKLINFGSKKCPLCRKIFI